MKRKKQDEEFWEKYEAYEDETTDDFIRRFSKSEAELRDTIAYLIRHRELIRDCELEKLEGEADMLIERLRENQEARLLESIACFKEINSLHKQLLSSGSTNQDDKP